MFNRMYKLDTTYFILHIIHFGLQKEELFIIMPGQFQEIQRECCPTPYSILASLKSLLGNLSSKISTASSLSCSQDTVPAWALPRVLEQSWLFAILGPSHSLFSIPEMHCNPSPPVTPFLWWDLELPFNKCSWKYYCFAESNMTRWLS